MLNTVVIAVDSLDPTTWEKLEVENVADCLMERYPEGLPHSARIYHEVVCEASDVTPFDENGVEKLLSLDGTFYVIVYPTTLAALPAWAIWAIIGAQVAVAIYMYSKIPNVSQRNLQQSSPNNTISGRSNQNRLGSRVPAIYGTVQSTPDLLSNYTVYESNKQVEYSYLCVGEGYYQVDASKIFDGTTPYQNINGNTLDIYAPFSSPNSGDPQLTIGTHITEPLKTVVRDNTVNGQTLLAPNSGSYVGNGTLNFSSTGVIDYVDPVGELIDPAPNFTNLFVAGNTINLTGSTVDGTYTISEVAENSITLNHPELVNPAWSTISVTNGSGTIATTGYSWVGEFVIAGGADSEVWANLVCLSGLFADDGQNQRAINVEVMLGITPITQAGVSLGAEVITNHIIYGSAKDRDPKAVTLKLSPPIKGAYYKVRAARYNPKDTKFKGQIVDEVKWQDIYSVKPVTQLHFGNVTTIRARTQATNQSTSLKERKLNLIVTRKLPKWLGGTSFSTELYPTNNAADIICAIALDKTFGNRKISELDLENIYNTAGTNGSVATYFGTLLACEFCYTFDNSNVTFEEAFGMVSGAVFCTAFRRGSKLKLLFEKQTDDSVMLFNHRNKLPNTENRTIRFGNEKNYDSLQYQWVSPTTTDNLQGKGNDSLETYYMPDEYYKPLSGYSVPNKIQSAGVRNKLQAYFQAHRIWNKIRYQNLSVEFTSTYEADILVPTERILVADNTRPDTQDGEVRYQTSLLLGLSQPVRWDSSTMILFLQLYDGSVDSIPVTRGAGSEDNEVLLSRAPRLPLVLEDDAFATTTYILVPNTEASSRAFLVTERSPASDLTTKIVAVNYDQRFYANDLDYKNGVVDINGNLI